MAGDTNSDSSSRAIVRRSGIMADDSAHGARTLQVPGSYTANANSSTTVDQRESAVSNNNTTSNNARPSLPAASATKRVTNRSRKSGNSTELPAFVRKLWDMVDSPSTDEYIHWTPDGQSFEVAGREQFERTVLPQYFKHNNFSSFVRQLNMYGWHKVQDVQSGAMHSNDNEVWRFKSDNFIKGRKDLLYNIVRNKGPKPGMGEDDDEIDLSRVLDELTILRSNQRAIGEDLYRIKKDNELLWRENSQSRERYNKHAETLERILRFLASLYGNQSRFLSDIMGPAGRPQAQRLLTAAPDADLGVTGMNGMASGISNNTGLNAGDISNFYDNTSIGNVMSGSNSKFQNGAMDDEVHGGNNLGTDHYNSVGGPDFGNNGSGNELKDRIFSISSANSPATSDVASPQSGNSSTGIKSSQSSSGTKPNSQSQTPQIPSSTPSTTTPANVFNDFSDMNDLLGDKTKALSNLTTPHSNTPINPVESRALTPIRTQHSFLGPNSHNIGGNNSAGYDTNNNLPNKLLYDLAQYGAGAHHDQQEMTDKLVNSGDDIDRIARSIDSQESSLRHFQELLQNHLRNSEQTDKLKDGDSGDSNLESNAETTSSAVNASPDQFKLEDFLVDPQDSFNLDHDHGPVNLGMEGMDDSGSSSVTGISQNVSPPASIDEPSMPTRTPKRRRIETSS